MGLQHQHGLVGAVSASLVLLAACAQTPTAAPAEPSGGHGRHTTAPVEEPESSAPVRDRGGAARAGALPRLKGEVGPGRTITISRDRVPAGRYRLVVRDLSSEHNWHINGTGVNKRTTVLATGRWVWRVRLRAGSYTILCDPHPTSMRTSLRVTAN